MQGGYHDPPHKGGPGCERPGTVKVQEGGHRRRKRGASSTSCTREDGGPVRWRGEELPRRAISPGLHTGLSLTLDARVEEEYCTGFQSQGFKGLLHVPPSQVRSNLLTPAPSPHLQQPEMVEYGFAVSPGTENFLVMEPRSIHAGNAHK